MQHNVCTLLLIAWPAEASTSTALDGHVTTTVLAPEGLGATVPPREGDTICTTGDSLDGEGDGPGDTLMPGEVLDAGEEGGWLVGANGWDEEAASKTVVGFPGHKGLA